MVTGIVVALPEELSTLSSKKFERGFCFPITENLIIACSGTGPNNARKAAQQLIAHDSQRLISWGCAAALDPSLKSGDLILPKQLLDQQQNTLSLQSEWHQQTRQLLEAQTSVHIGTLAESATIISLQQEKKILHKDTGAIALDMESIAVAKVAQQTGIKCLVIRAIADTADLDLPAAITHALNKQGDVVLSKLLTYLLWHPNQLTGLIKTGLHFRQAQNKLKVVAKYLATITANNNYKTA